MTKDGLLLGIDLGTGGCKITIIDPSGTVVLEGVKEYKTYHPHPGWSEQDPEDWYEAVCGILKSMRDNGKTDLGQRIAALSLDGSTHNAVLLDKNFKVLRPAIMWTDQRSVEESAWLEDKFGELIFKKAYQKPSPTWTLPQLMWVRKHEPKVFSQITYIMFVKDYIRYRLTGTWHTDYIEAQGTLFFDMEEQKWSKEICKIGGIPLSVLPPLVKPTDITGKITKNAASQTGLAQGTPVIAGSSDSAIEDYGAGAVKPNQCIIKLATAGNVNVMTDRPCPHPQTLTYSHVVPGMWYTVVATNTAASAKRWFRDLFCSEEVEEAKKSGRNVYELMDNKASKAPVGSDGLFFHPYLLGERAPYWDPCLRAGFAGITMQHSKAHFIRALLEGVAFSLRDCFRVIEGMGLMFEDIRLIGGGARSLLWSQIVSNVFGREVLRPSVSDASFGAALLAGVGIGIFENERQAVEKCVRIADIIKPQPEIHDKYEKLFKLYCQIHDNLAPVYSQLDSVLKLDRENK